MADALPVVEVSRHGGGFVEVTSPEQVLPDPVDLEDGTQRAVVSVGGVVSITRHADPTRLRALVASKLARPREV